MCNCCDNCCGDIGGNANNHCSENFGSGFNCCAGFCEEGPATICAIAFDPCYHGETDGSTNEDDDDDDDDNTIGGGLGNGNGP